MKRVSETIILNNVRCSFVFATKTNKHEKYQIQPLIPKDSELAKKLKAAQTRIAKAAFGDAVKAARLKLPLRDGDEERDGNEYEGMYFLNANSGNPPGIVNRFGKAASDVEIDEQCYSGAVFTVSISLYSFDSKDGGKPGVAAGFNNLMLRGGKGERMDGRKSAVSEFAEFTEDGDSDDEFDDLD
jgi:hypothetical protein